MTRGMKRAFLRPLNKWMKNIPYWERPLPKYPQYQPGNPQNRVFFCPFWMKIVNREGRLPPDQVQFEVHPEMSKLDIKQYLKKIYNVDVLHVRTHIVEGHHAKELSRHRMRFLKTTLMQTERDRKIAYVQLLKGETFEFPPICEQGTIEKAEARDKNLESLKEDQDETTEKGIPKWFLG